MKPSGHAIKCGCYSCSEYRRDNTRRIKHERRWAEREIRDVQEGVQEGAE